MRFCDLQFISWLSLTSSCELEVSALLATMEPMAG
jgi:hypothetical protein